MDANPSLDGLRSRGSQFFGLLLQTRERWRAYDVYLSALLIFAASRLVVVVGINLGKLLVRVPDPAKWDAGPDWYDRLLRWDSGWYATIVNDGYRYSDDGPSPTVFYPVYPLVAYAVKSLSGVDHFMALLLVANVASLIVALLMTKFVRDELGDETALWSLAFFCFFPSSLFLSAGYTESLFLMFVLLSFVLLVRQKFVAAAALAGLSLGTRSVGIVMIPVILWEMGRRSSLPWPRLLPRMVMCGVVAASGLLAYVAYLGIKFGHPLAFATGQAFWHGPSLSFLDRFVSGLTLASFHHTNLRLAGWFVCSLVLTIWSFSRLRPAVSLYGLGALALPYFTLGITDSMNRFVLVCFPAFVCLGILCRGRPWLGNALVGIFAALLLQTAALFSQWYWVG
jgi:hypothetical protein